MSLVREATTKYPGTVVGDMKIAHYAISYTAGAITKPTNDPAWMLLNGAAISRTTYPVLFALFGTTYGAGDGSTTFNIPDLTEGQLPIGKGLSSFTTIGASGGEINHTLTTSEIASHGHGNTLAFGATGSHGHSVSAGLQSGVDSHSHSATDAETTTPLGPIASIGTSPFSNTAAVSLSSTNTGSAGSHSHTGSLTIDPNDGVGGDSAKTVITKGGSVSNATGGSGHNNMQPYVVVGGWLVKFG